MQKELIHTQEAPAAIGPYSQAIRFKDIVYFSGQIPLDPQTMTIVSEDFAKQAEQVLINLETVTKVAGGCLDDLLKITIYLVDLADFPIINDMMLKFFKKPYPARTTIQVAALPKAAKIEIDAVMLVRDSG